MILLPAFQNPAFIITSWLPVALIAVAKLIKTTSPLEKKNLNYKDANFLRDVVNYKYMVDDSLSKYFTNCCSE